MFPLKQFPVIHSSWVSWFTLDFQSPLIPVLSVVMGQAKTLHIPFD